MSNLLKSYQLQMEEFKRTNPYSILNFGLQELNTRYVDNNYIPNDDQTQFMIYNDKKVKEAYSKQGIDSDSNTTFLAGNINNTNQIVDPRKIPTIIRDPNITTFGDTYSQAPFVTNILDKNSGRNIEHIVYRNRNNIVNCSDRLSDSICDSDETFLPDRQCRGRRCSKERCCRKNDISPTPSSSPTPPLSPVERKDKLHDYCKTYKSDKSLSASFLPGCLIYCSKDTAGSLIKDDKDINETTCRDDNPEIKKRCNTFDIEETFKMNDQIGPDYALWCDKPK
tara:strand:+ start:167 stop:1009 length:843 start_codon:yes stop_codon:yes gene_type:complete